MYFIKTLLITSFILTFIQDSKERSVYWFLFLIIAISQTALFYNNSIKSFFLVSLGINILIILFLILSVFLYTKFKMKLKLNEAIGIGDLLFFFGLALAFPPITFTILFVFSLIFSLILHLFFKKNDESTIPLAGYMSLFFIGIYLLSWKGIITNLYLF